MAIKIEAFVPMPQHYASYKTANILVARYLQSTPAVRTKKIAFTHIIPTA
ncbi:hypothetical protein [Nostoc piscinale]|nr:hypothetical protein [Nostoc piscinale]